MQVARQADAIDLRLVFRSYAALTGATGLILFLWGPMWLGVHLSGQPWGKAALIRVAGAVMMAVGCCAAALASGEDSLSLRRALVWFAAAHGIVFVVVGIQREAIWGPGLADWVAGLALAIAWLFLYFWWTAEGERMAPRPSLISLFGTRDSTTTERLRSNYEEQIRQAAGQEERNRLARELHDSVKQQVFAIQTSAATAEVRFDTDPEGARQALAQVRSAARDAMTEMEVMLDQLRAAPLENIGLVEALKKQCETLGFRTGARVDFAFEELPPSEDLAPGTHQAIFRVAQEALANVARHARATRVKARLSGLGGWVRLTVEDDGKGFQPEETQRGMGIANMRARAEEFGGFLDIETPGGAGTTIRFSVPYSSGSAVVHLQRALIYGTLSLFSAAIAMWRSPMQGAIAFVCIVACCRQALAWRRMNKRNLSAHHRAG